VRSSVSKYCVRQDSVYTCTVKLSPNIRQVNCRGEGMDSQRDTFSSLSWVSHLPAGPSCVLQFSNKFGFHQPILLQEKTIKPMFLFQRYNNDSMWKAGISYLSLLWTSFLFSFYEEYNILPYCKSLNILYEYWRFLKLSFTFLQGAEVGLARPTA
jgi:hypothetical protein